MNQGYLTLQAGRPKPTTDQIAKDTLWYSPDCGKSIWIEGSSVDFLGGPSDQNGWSINVGGLAVGSYHVFGSPEGLVVGAAWPTFIDPLTLLVRRYGQLVDPATLYPCLGSIRISVAGQLTCHVEDDFDRKYEVYNFSNRKPIAVRVITHERDYAYCPVNQYPAFVPFNNNPLNRGSIILGQPERVSVRYAQGVFLNTGSGAYGIINAVGWNGQPRGKWAGGAQDYLHFAGGITNIASFVDPAAVGANVATMLIGAAVNSANRSSVAYSAAGPVWGYGKDANSLMVIEYEG